MVIPVEVEMKYGRLFLYLFFGGCLILIAGFGAREALFILMEKGVRIPRNVHIGILIGAIVGAISISSRFCVGEIKRLKGDD